METIHATVLLAVLAILERPQPDAESRMPGDYLFSMIRDARRQLCSR